MWKTARKREKGSKLGMSMHRKHTISVENGLGRELGSYVHFHIGLEL